MTRRRRLHPAVNLAIGIVGCAAVFLAWALVNPWAGLATGAMFTLAPTVWEYWT
jgi:hypothetical protein